MDSDLWEILYSNSGLGAFIEEEYKEDQRRIGNYIKGATEARKTTTDRLNKMDGRLSNIENILESIANHFEIDLGNSFESKVIPFRERLQKA